jgi:D-lactate dehydrogenase (cytochrome)
MADDLHSFLEDAAHYPGGHAAGVVFPRNTSEVVDAVVAAPAVLAVGAQSSLTGGATPMGELIVASSKMARVLHVSGSTITVEPGVSVAAIQEALAGVDAWFPPAPTFTGATAGGIVATNAAGAATFKYGSTRDWVLALTVVLADGVVLSLQRDEVIEFGGGFVVPTRRGATAVPLPRYTMPDVAKRAAGYHAAPGMDLIDLFIGSEGTLGVITEVTLRAVSPAPCIALAFLPCASTTQGLDLVSELRAASMDTWRSGDPLGIDVAAIEHMDRRSIQILREDGVDGRHNVSLPADTAIALLMQIELPASTTQAAAYDQIADALSSRAADAPLVRLCRMLDRFNLLGVTELALAGDRHRMGDLLAVREAVPAGVNQRVGLAKQRDARIAKTAADMVVPFDRLPQMLQTYRAGFESRGLDYAMWGHISDGNVHPNVIPRSYADVEAGRDAILEFGREAARLGGCPLAEHGVGRNPVKQELLRQLYGDSGIEQMRAVKRALDPDWKLAPGVIFPIVD